MALRGYDAWKTTEPDEPYSENDECYLYCTAS